MTTKHAPTPWIMDIGDTRRPFPFIMAPEGGPGMMVAEVVSGRLDAAFIVRACNNYETLLAALKRLLACRWVDETSSDAVTQAKAAIAAAEKGATP